MLSDAPEACQHFFNFLRKPRNTQRGSAATEVGPANHANGRERAKAKNSAQFREAKRFFDSRQLASFAGKKIFLYSFVTKKI
jgi:hypothetical protein